MKLGSIAQILKQTALIDMSPMPVVRFAMIVFAALPCISAWAQQPFPNTSHLQPAGLFVQEGRSTARFRWDYNIPSKSPYQRNHYSILKVFRDVMGEHWESTVRILHEDRQLCLGIVVDKNGWIISKSSEIPDDEDITIRFADAGRLVARVVSRRPDVDLVLLKVSRDGLTPIKWDAETKVQVGRFIATTDSKSLPLAVGVVSVNARPIDAVQAVLGIRLDEGTNGVIASRILTNGGANRAGILENDVILAINDQSSSSLRSIQNMISSNRAGDRVKVTLQREGVKLDVVAQLTDMSIVLGNREEAEVNGQISARSSDFPSAFQHDTVLMPNQCGGPLVDLEGNVVGINIARAGRVHCFALPMNVIVPTVEEMLRSATIALQRRSDGENVLVDSLESDSIAKLTTATTQ
jgi:serine protease Do